MTHQGSAVTGRFVRGPGWFAIIVGIAMVLIWAWLLFTGDVPEIELDPLGMWFHIGAELATAAMLVLAGRGLLSGAVWARKAYLVATGMLLLAVIHAVAWYGGRGEVGMVIAMLVLAVLAVFFALRSEE